MNEATLLSSLVLRSRRNGETEIPKWALRTQENELPGFLAAEDREGSGFHQCPGIEAYWLYLCMRWQYVFPHALVTDPISQPIPCLNLDQSQNMLVT